MDATESKMLRVAVAGRIVTIAGDDEEQLHTLRSALVHTTRAWDDLFGRMWRSVVGAGPHGPDGVAELFAALDALKAERDSLQAERDRLQRACDEALPREAIFCPACGARHIEGPRHDNPSVDGRKRPHHTHRCGGCGHVWDSGRWSFGVAPGEERQGGERPGDALSALSSLMPLASRAYRRMTLPRDRQRRGSAPHARARPRRDAPRRG